MLEDFFDSLNLFDDFNSTKRYPFTNIAYDKNKVVYVTMALAGFTKDDIRVQYKNCELIVEGSKNIKTDDLTYIQKYISDDKFQKAIKFSPKLYQDADVSASMTDGLLKVTVKPKEKQEKLKYIEIL